MSKLSKEIPPYPEVDGAGIWGVYELSLFYFEFPNSDHDGYAWSESWSQAVSDHGSCNMKRVTMIKPLCPTK